MDARADVYFFLNGVLGAIAVGVVWLADFEWRGYWMAAYLIPVVAAYVLYRAAVGAAERWGTEQRASIDLHRFEVYEKLGVRRPISFTDERDTVAPAVNAFLLIGSTLPDALYRQEDTKGGKK